MNETSNIANEPVLWVRSSDHDLCKINVQGINHLGIRKNMGNYWEIYGSEDWAGKGGNFSYILGRYNTRQEAKRALDNIGDAMAQGLHYVVLQSQTVDEIQRANQRRMERERNAQY